MFASGYGLTPDPWQFGVLEVWLGEDKYARWSAPRAGLAVPRQNGKNALLEVRELYGVVALGEKFLHTAHEVKTARKAFLRLAGFFENPRQWPELAELVESIRKTNGQEAIVLKNGGSVEFVARSRGSGRGYTVDVLVCDEAQELTDEQLEALLPTISSAPTGNPQIILTGTPPPPGSPADVFVRTRTEAHEGTDDRLAWHEWSAADGFDLDDPEEWARNNPALGLRLHIEVIETERKQLSDDGFARERLGVWNTNRGGQVINPDVWLPLADPNPPKVTTPVMAVDVTPDRSSASVAFAGLRPDGLRHVEIVESRRGTGWVVDLIVEHIGQRKDASVILDASGPAGSLITELTAKGVEVNAVSTREMTQACGAFYDAVHGGTVSHFGQQPLNAAIAAARKRSLGDAWAWHRKDPNTDISPLVAVTLALFGHDQQASKKPKRTGKVW